MPARHRLDKLNMYCNDDQGRVYQNCKFRNPLDKVSCARV